MATGEFYTYNVWELRPGHQGRELEDLSRIGIIPAYAKIKGVREIKLFRIEEGDGAGRYLAVTVYESREAYNKWFTSNSFEFQQWQSALRAPLERWVEVAGQTGSYRATLVLDHQYESNEPPPPPSTGPTIVF